MISIMNINKKILNVIYKVLAVMLALILWEIAALKIDSSAWQIIYYMA